MLFLLCDVIIGIFFWLFLLILLSKCLIYGCCKVKCLYLGLNFIDEELKYVFIFCLFILYLVIFVSNLFIFLFLFMV